MFLHVEIMRKIKRRGVKIECWTNEFHVMILDNALARTPKPVLLSGKTVSETNTMNKKMK
jgi:hypothetical protein